MSDERAQTRKSGYIPGVRRVPVDPDGNRESRRLAKKLGVQPRGRLAKLAAKMRRTDTDEERG